MKDERKTVLVGELEQGDVIESSGIKVHMVLPHPTNAHELLVLGTNGRWEHYGNQRMGITIKRTVVEWDDLTPELMRNLSNEFAPGFQLDEEFVKPLWLNACSCIEVEFEDNEGERPKDDDVLTRRAYVRVESALHVLLYGTTPDGTWTL